MARLQQQATHRMATDGVSMYSAGSVSFDAQRTYLQGVPLRHLNAQESQSFNQWDEYYDFQGETIEIFGPSFKVTDVVVGDVDGEELYVTMAH